MKQLDIFKENGSDYLYGEIEKVRKSMDKRCRAIFSLLNELQNEVIKIQEKDEEAM